MVSSIYPPAKPIRSLDVIQGIALLGMLIINVQTYSLFAFLSPQQVYQLQLDRAETYIPVQLFFSLFIRGQCDLIYSFLFGFCFYQLWKNDKQAGLEADRMAKRRLWILLGLGMIHGLLFWFGDLLHQYALLGFSLLYFNKQSIITLTRWVIGLVLLAIILQISLTVIQPKSALEMESVLETMITSWRRGSAWDVMRLQPVGLWLLHSTYFKQGFAPYIHHEILFLTGLIIAKLRPQYRISELKVRLSLLQLLIFPVAFLTKGFSVLLELGLLALPAASHRYQPLLVSLATFIGTPLLAMVYLLDIGLNARFKPSGWTVLIGRVGQMGLTNYLLQTILCMIVFYGLGLSGRLMLLESILPVLGIYAFQMVFSHVWLNCYPQGPLEWLYNRLIYGRVSQPDAVTTIEV